MDALQLQSFTEQLKISPVEILREETELLILQKLSQSPLSKNLIFKGGTALRLCHGSPRFSQDLDFTQKEKIALGELEQVLQKIVQGNPEISVKEVLRKRFTVFGLLLINSPLLKQPFSVKIEISTKKYLLSEPDYSRQICRSPVSPFSPLLYVYSLKAIFKEKKLALKTRGEPRDYFDLWFIAQKLGERINLPKPKLHPGKFKGEIAQLLPDNWKFWPAEFLKKYE